VCACCTPLAAQFRGLREAMQEVDPAEGAEEGKEEEEEEEEVDEEYAGSLGAGKWRHLRLYCCAPTPEGTLTHNCELAHTRTDSPGCVHVSERTHTDIHTHVHTRTQTYIHMYTHVHKHTYTHIHTHTHTYIHAHTHTHTHTHACAHWNGRCTLEGKAQPSTRPKVYAPVKPRRACTRECANARTCPCSRTQVRSVWPSFRQRAGRVLRPSS